MTEKDLGVDREDARLLPRLSTTSSTALITSAGRDLDALVAEKVMGLVVDRNGRVEKDANWYGPPPEYSISIADAWLVVERLDATRGHFDGQHVSWTLERSPGSGNGDEPNDGYRKPGNVGGWSASFYTYEYQWVSARADTAPLAICLAALRAV